MSSLTPQKFVEWAVWYAEQRGLTLTPIRIVKFLYLLDLYHARQGGGITLTGWKWRFVHYGPFCAEALDAISSAESAGLIVSKVYASKFDRDGKFYQHCADDAPEGIPDLLPGYVCCEIKNAVRLWSDDTYGLLNHVYFDTEPMISALPSQTLDFTLAEMPTVEKPIEMIRLSNKKLKKARELLGKLRSAQRQRLVVSGEIITGNLQDRAYFQALQALESTEDPIFFSGTLDLTS